jgi:hypothetical protein
LLGLIVLSLKREDTLLEVRNSFDKLTKELSTPIKLLDKKKVN